MRMLEWEVGFELIVPMARVYVVGWMMDLKVVLPLAELLTSALKWAMEWAMGKCQRFYLVVATAVVFFHEQRVPTH